MEIVNGKESDYTSVDYWNERYSSEESFDWFKGYDFFSHQIKKSVRPSDKILMLGCGNSSLSEDMYKDGFHNIVNIDYSSMVINNMKNRSKEASAMDWLVMDARKMTFPNESFNVVIEKGTLDAVMANESSPWKITKETSHLIEEILHEVNRVLIYSGHFLSISFHQPHFRNVLFSNYNWSTECQSCGEGFHYFIYTMVKKKAPTPVVQENFYNLKTNLTSDHLESDQEDFLNTIMIGNE